MDNTNTELVEALRIKGKAALTGTEARFLRLVADRLEAAEAELTRRDTVIAEAHRVVDEFLDGTSEGVGPLAHVAENAIAAIHEVLAAAPVSLEAVKAETTTEWSLESRGVRMPATTSEQLARATQMPWDTLVSREVTEWRPVSAEGDNRG